ncbi:MAG: flagellar hook-basal body protein [Planctomycetota bacterium]|nr:flagellar hook-basal body protein [Planctomycetota bacterium]
MNYGLYISASGMSAQMARQDVLSNNLANVSTTAFKPDTLAIRQREPARIEDGLTFLPSNKLLERLGAGVMPVATRVSTSQGALERTGNALDVGIEGDGFLLVRAAPGPEGLRVTRDGRLTVSSEGRLVTASDGFPVLDASDNPITINPTRPLKIRSDGAVVQDDSEIARLAFVAVPEPERLVKTGSGLMAAPEGQTLQRRPAAGRILQEHLEASATDAVKAMMSVTSASRAVESGATIIGYINEMMGRAINSLGRVS